MSAAGRQYVVEELRRALLEVTHVKEVMQKTEEKHKHLMDALTHSCEKKTVSQCRLRSLAPIRSDRSVSLLDLEIQMLVFNIWIKIPGHWDQAIKGWFCFFSGENPVEEKWSINVIILMHFLEPSQSPVGITL